MLTSAHCTKTAAQEFSYVSSNKQELCKASLAIIHNPKRKQGTGNEIPRLHVGLQMGLQANGKAPS